MSIGLTEKTKVKYIDEFDGENEIVYNTMYISPQKIKMNWYKNDGKLIDETYSGSVGTWMWTAHIDGISYENIVRVDYPPISYETNGEYLVKVTYIAKGENEWNAQN